MIRRYLHPYFLLPIPTLLYSRLSGIVFLRSDASFSVFVCFPFDACPILRSFPLGHARGPCCHLVFLVPYLKGSEGFRLNFRRMLFLYPYREENRGFRLDSGWPNPICIVRFPFPIFIRSREKTIDLDWIYI